jgi:aconitase A
MDTTHNSMAETEFAGRRIFSLKKFEEQRGSSIAGLPYVNRVLLENLLRH